MGDREVYGVYADKVDGGLAIRRGYDRLLAGKRTLVVEDLTTTGGSIKKVIDAARAAGADLVGAVAICNRGDVTKAQIGDPPRFETLVNIQLDQWEAAKCELCANNIPVNTDVGHGAEFLKQRDKGAKSV
jgi:orotate phosphoribosyltransferase